MKLLFLNFYLGKDNSFQRKILPLSFPSENLTNAVRNAKNRIHFITTYVSIVHPNINKPKNGPTKNVYFLALSIFALKNTNDVTHT